MQIELDPDYITVDFPQARPLVNKKGWQCARCGLKVEPYGPALVCEEFSCPLKQSFWR